MGVGENFKKVNVWWDRVEVCRDRHADRLDSDALFLLQKVIYLIIDMSLNAYFILTVKRRLVSYGVCNTLFPIFPCRLACLAAQEIRRPCALQCLYCGRLLRYGRLHYLCVIRHSRLPRLLLNLIASQA